MHNVAIVTSETGEESNSLLRLTSAAEALQQAELKSDNKKKKVIVFE